jgi:hypothetical protein
MQADYIAQQLSAIAAAVRRPLPWSTNPWILAAFSTFLGVIGGFLGQLLLTAYADHKARKTILRMGYRYVAELIAVLDTLVSAPEELQAHTSAATKVVLPTSPEEYSRAHREIYIDLPEYVSFDVIFNHSQQLRQPSPEYDWKSATLQVISSSLLRSA